MTVATIRPAPAARPAPLPHRRPGAGRAGFRCVLVGALVLALLAYGHQAFVRSLLGPLHHHAAVHSVERLAWIDPLSDWVQEWRTWRDQRLPPRMAAWAAQGLHPDARPPRTDHGHSAHHSAHHHSHHSAHHAPDRHHHAADDASAVRLDAPLADSVAQAAAGSTALPWHAARPGWHVAAPPPVHTAWPPARRVGFRDAPARLPERPPRA